MSIGVAAAHRFGFVTKNGHNVWLVPAAVAGGVTLVTALLVWAGVLKHGYFSPYVAATAAVAAKLCVRAGLLAAVLSIVCWDFFVVPPVLVLSAPSASEITAWLAAIAAGLLVAPRMGKEPPPSRPTGDTAGGLPFVRRKPTPNGIDKHRTASCWDVQRTGDWGSDDHYGRELGRLWIDRRRSSAEGSPPLSFILSDMLDAGEFSGVEAGFANAVERAVAASSEEAVNFALLVSDHQSDNMRA